MINTYLCNLPSLLPCFFYWWISMRGQRGICRLKFIKDQNCFAFKSLVTRDSRLTQPRCLKLLFFYYFFMRSAVFGMLKFIIKMSTVRGYGCMTIRKLHVTIYYFKKAFNTKVISYEDLNIFNWEKQSFRILLTLSLIINEMINQ